MKPVFRQTNYVIPIWSKTNFLTVKGRNNTGEDKDSCLTEGKVYRIREWKGPNTFTVYNDFGTLHLCSISCWRSADFEENLKKILEE